jgi:hypothetical protein
MAQSAMPRHQERPATTLIWLTREVLFLLASPVTTVVLLAILAAVLAWAIHLETNHGSEHSRWFVYESPWFFSLLALLGVNSFCAVASRLPWRRQHTGFIVTHAGLFVLLAGVAWSLWRGMEGRVSLGEGETAQHMVLAHRGQITAFWVGRPQEPPFEFTFAGGPVDWREGKRLDIGNVDGVQARILAYYRHANADETWVVDQSRRGGPAVRFKALRQDGAPIADGWLVDQQFGDAVAVGPIRLQLVQAAADKMLEDFMQPSLGDLGVKGRLDMYFGDVVERVSLDDSVGRKIPLGSTGVAVEIAGYLPHATPDRMGNFTSKSGQPKNPMVELLVHLPDREQPLRQIAFAKDPLLNLDGVYSEVCPVKFRFHHAAVPLQTAIELLQTSDGKLFGRQVSVGHCACRGALGPGDRFDLPGQCRLEIIEHVPHARRQVKFAPSGPAISPQARVSSAPAALVEVAAGVKREQVWLRCDDSAYGRSTVAMPGGTLAVSYEHGHAPLGFSLTLIESRPDRKPGSKSQAAFSCKVQIAEEQRGLKQERVISRNQPLTRGNFTFYPFLFDEGAHSRSVSSFKVVCDPGRTLKHGGSLMVVLGLAILFLTRAFFPSSRGEEPPRISRPSSQAAFDQEQSPVARRPAA